MSGFFKRTESMGEGEGPPPQEAAPAYDDVIHLHGVAPASSSSGYAAIPQTDIEHDAPAHTHSSSPLPPQPSEPQETLAQTIAGVFRPKPHVHCEVCDHLAERREIRANERHVCTRVTWVFIVLFICAMIVGIVIANTMVVWRKKHHG